MYVKESLTPSPDSWQEGGTLRTVISEEACGVAALQCQGIHLPYHTGNTENACTTCLLHSCWLGMCPYVCIFTFASVKGVCVHTCMCVSSFASLWRDVCASIFSSVENWAYVCICTCLCACASMWACRCVCPFFLSDLSVLWKMCHAKGPKESVK